MSSISGNDGTPSGFTPQVPFGVWGDSGSQGPFAGGNGVIGSSALSSGVAGFTLAGSDWAAGVFGAGPAVGVAGGVNGSNTAPEGLVGVYGTGSDGQSLGGIGVFGESDTESGVFGESISGSGVAGESTSGSGVSGLSATGAGVVGVSGQDVGLLGISNGTGITAAGGTYAGFFFGNVSVTGSISKGGGGFMIDHPIDPANRYLRHSFVESSEMKNFYDDIVVCNGDGEATVSLPEWFEALNDHVRYQLTAVGAPAPDLHISEELKNNQFKLAGGSAGLKVSWQVTGVRRDRWAMANPVVTEEDKTEEDYGRYLHPEAHGQPRENGIKAGLQGTIQRHLARIEHP